VIMMMMMRRRWRRRRRRKEVNEDCRNLWEASCFTLTCNCSNITINVHDGPTQYEPTWLITAMWICIYAGAALLLYLLQLLYEQYSQCHETLNYSYIIRNRNVVI
jgi:cytochrome c oxidase assembly factor CtaG